MVCISVYNLLYCVHAQYCVYFKRDCVYSKVRSGSRFRALSKLMFRRSAREEMLCCRILRKACGSISVLVPPEKFENQTREDGKSRNNMLQWLDFGKNSIFCEDVALTRGRGAKVGIPFGLVTHAVRYTWSILPH